MRIDRLYIKSYKNLKDFEVDFDVTSSRQVIVGRNGVGKSNLLEAIAWIFRDLDLEEHSQFEYEIEYHCNRHYVKIQSLLQNDQLDKGSPTFTRTYAIAPDQGVPSENREIRKYVTIKQSEFYKRNRSIREKISPDRLLPLYVFGYYSGTSGRFNEIFEKHEERYFREQVTGQEAPLRPLFMARPHHSQFSLLSFFASHDDPAKLFLREELHIDKLESVLFALHEPYWKRQRGKTKSSSSLDDRFWNAGGKVSAFLGALFEHSFAPMSGVTRKKISIGQERTLERRFCYVPNQNSLQSLAENLEPKEFFARLESTIFSDLVSTDGSDVRIRIRLVGERESITFKELSEGEQQLLTIIGLMRFTAQNESLFLLDEPDTYLNPAWCLDFLSNLRKYGVEPPNSQMLMTTHNPLTFAGLDKNEVVIIEREMDDRITSQHPPRAPKGMGFQAILTSDFFRMRSTLDRATLAKLDEKRELAMKENKTDTDRKRLSELDVELGKLDFSRAARDPLYLEFIDAMTKAQTAYPKTGEPAPTAEGWRLRKQIAKEIAEKLSSRGSTK